MMQNLANDSLWNPSLIADIVIATGLSVTTIQSVESENFHHVDFDGPDFGVSVEHRDGQCQLITRNIQLTIVRLALYGIAKIYKLEIIESHA